MNAPERPPVMNEPLHGVLRGLLAIAMLALGLILAWSFWAQVSAPTSLTDTVMAELPRSGVANPVTAVLLNFRAFDTMLELAVLLLVAVTMGVLREHSPAPATYQTAPLPLSDSPLLHSLVRDLTPLIILIGGYLLWIGAKEPGGAFQAGAVLASAPVLAHLAGRPWPTDQKSSWFRGLLVLGTGAFLISALAMQALTGGYFIYPPAWAGIWLLGIETAATLSIAVTLYVAFRAVMPVSTVPT